MSCGDNNYDPEAEGVIVQDDSVTVVAEATTLNFTGAGVTVTDVGGVATIAIPGTGTAQVFSYTAVGGEGAQFTVNLPAARADALYQVQVTMAGPAANAFKMARPLASTRTVNGFDIELSAIAEVGDIFFFTVEDPT